MRVGTRALLSGRALECAGGAGGALWWHCAVLTARKRRSACDLHDESHDSRLDAGAGGVGARELLFDEKTPDEKKNCFMRPITNATDSFTFDVFLICLKTALLIPYGLRSNIAPRGVRQHTSARHVSSRSTRSECSRRFEQPPPVSSGQNDEALDLRLMTSKGTSGVQLHSTVLLGFEDDSRLCDLSMSPTSTGLATRAAAVPNAATAVDPFTGLALVAPPEPFAPTSTACGSGSGYGSGMGVKLLSAQELGIELSETALTAPPELHLGGRLLTPRLRVVSPKAARRELLQQKEENISRGPVAGAAGLLLGIGAQSPARSTLHTATHSGTGHVNEAAPARAQHRTHEESALNRVTRHTSCGHISTAMGSRRSGANFL